MIRDIHGNEIAVGSLLVPQDFKVYHFKVTEMSEPVIQRTPMGMQPVRKIKAVSEIEINLIGDANVNLQFLSVKGPVPVEDPKLVKV